MSSGNNTNAAASSSRHYPCKWDYCARTFGSIDELKAHFSFDHIQHERPAYIPSHKRRRRPDGTWALVEESYEASFPPITSQSVSDLTGSTAPSFAIPSLPGAPFYNDALAPPDPALGAPVDFGAFLRSPSPTSPARLSLPLQSTPASQVPPPSSALEAAGTAGSSAAGVSAASSGPFLTQAFPPTQLFSQPSQASLSAEHSNDSSWGQPPDDAAPRPPQTIAFGARAPPSDSPARRVSASGVGFSWGLKK